MSPASTTSTEEDAASGLLPLVLKLAGESCLVVGGGRVAARKIETLLRAGARVTVVAPHLGERLSTLLAAGGAAAGGGGDQLEWQERAFRDEDVLGRRLVVAATNDPDVNRRASAAARRGAVLVNVVDDLEASDFLVPSVLERGPLQVAVSTSGLAPALSASLRRRLEELFPAEMAEVVRLVGRARRRVLGAGLPAVERDRLNGRIAQLDYLGLLAAGGPARVRAALAEALPEDLDLETSPAPVDSPAGAAS